MNSNEEQGLVKLSADELALVIAYRRCCPEHQTGLRWFANASSSNCSHHIPSNLVVLLAKA